MEGFSFVTPVTGLNRPNTGKEDDDDDDYYFLHPHSICCLLLLGVNIILSILQRVRKAM
jgi:hypothetical protein